MPSSLLFQSTLPVWGATGAPADAAARSPISIHAPRVGSDKMKKEQIELQKNFNPRSPCGKRLRLQCQQWENEHISIHAPRVGSDGFFHTRQIRICSYFNPRSPCGKRRLAVGTIQAFPSISIHAPRVGSDRLTTALSSSGRIFQSTLPVWEATYCSGPNISGIGFQSTLPVWEATRWL